MRQEASCVSHRAYSRTSACRCGRAERPIHRGPSRDPRSLDRSLRGRVRRSTRSRCKPNPRSPTRCFARPSTRPPTASRSWTRPARSCSSTRCSSSSSSTARRARGHVGRHVVARELPQCARRPSGRLRRAPSYPVDGYRTRSPGAAAVGGRVPDRDQPEPAAHRRRAVGDRDRPRRDRAPGRRRGATARARGAGPRRRPGTDRATSTTP